MFIFRRKLLGIFSAFVLFVIIATINHYLYLGPQRGDRARKAAFRQEAGGRGGTKINLGDNVVDAQHDNSDQEVSVADEIKAHKMGMGQHRVVFMPRGSENEDEVREDSGAVKAKPPQVAQEEYTDDDDDDQAGYESNGARYVPRRRVVHLDLKGAPPTVAFLMELMPILKSAGATALLIEYEDMFPFWGKLRNISATNAYTKEDVAALVRAAEDNELEVIPLVQTFGHMEFVLKLQEFRESREVPYYPQAICPSQDRSWNIITQIIDQVLTLHPKARWLHVGCDEVYQLGQCSLCSERMAAKNSDPKAKLYYDAKALFLDHVRRVGEFVRKKRNSVNGREVMPIIWDDMLRSIPEDTLSQSGIGRLVEPMVWVYVEDVDRFVDPITWMTFASVFRHIWVASAFKASCAFVVVVTAECCYCNILLF